MAKPTFTAAGTEIDSDIDNEWENFESQYSYYDDDLLHGDDPLAMERFEFS